MHENIHHKLATHHVTHERSVYGFMADTGCEVCKLVDLNPINPNPKLVDRVACEGQG